MLAPSSDLLPCPKDYTLIDPFGSDGPVAPEKDQGEATIPVKVSKGTLQIVGIGDAMQV